MGAVATVVGLSESSAASYRTPALTADVIAGLAHNPNRSKALVIVSPTAVNGRLSYPVNPDVISETVGVLGGVVRIPSVKEAWALTALSPSLSTYGGAVRVVIHGGRGDTMFRAGFIPSDELLDGLVASCLAAQKVLSVDPLPSDPSTVTELRALAAALRDEVRWLRSQHPDTAVVTPPA